MKNLDQIAVNAIRVLSAEAIQKAKSGHPGLPMGTAAFSYNLWAEHMKHNPKNPEWINRDRFVLSAGHGSMLVYSLLYLFGYGLELEDLKQFRQYGSKTPGHPEHGHTKGVETTTGPLGQGFANGVGMAIAEEYLAGRFNKPDLNIIDHYTYVLSGDGCMMEGITSEAASLAGTLRLGKLIVMYDSNSISIEGNTDIAFREDVAKRFEAYGWQVIKVSDGNDTAAFSNAVSEAKSEKEKPSLIIITTQIGYGCPAKQGKPSAHGEPLGDENVRLTKENLGWNTEEPFFVPEELKAYMSDKVNSLGKYQEEWDRLWNRYSNEHPKSTAELKKWFSSPNLDYLLEDKDFWSYDDKPLATRIASETILNRLSKVVPNLIGGSADLSPSNKTIMKDRGNFTTENKKGSNMHFGVREHAMAAIANGMAVHGGLIPYVATFFVFSDYMKGAMRISAIMKQRVVYVLTHDSIGVGEDGPTHQPIEQLAALRSMPGFNVFRPADLKETAAAWYYAVNGESAPTALVLSRQNMPSYAETGKDALKGGYVIADAENGKPDIILISSGAELELVYEAAKNLKEKGINARVVSMPSFELFDAQPAEYREKVLPSNIRARLAVEAGSSFGWHKYIGIDGDIIAMDDFGTSGPYEVLFEKYGFSTGNVVERALKLLKKIL